MRVNVSRCYDGYLAEIQIPGSCTVSSWQDTEDHAVATAIALWRDVSGLAYTGPEAYDTTVIKGAQ